MKKLKQSGFTLIEVLLSTVIISVLVGLSLPLYQTFQSRNDLDIAAQTVVYMLRRAQTYARGVSGDSQWGVEVTSTQATLYKGASYGTRVSAFDEIYEMPGGITVSGGSGSVFAKLTGFTSSASLTLTARTSDARTITINTKGNVDY